MKSNKIFQIGAIGLCLLTITACQGKVNEEASTRSVTESNLQGDSSLEQINLSGLDLQSNEEVDNQILTKELNAVFVWQPTCPPCQKELKALEKVYKDYEDKINFVGLGVAEESKSVEQAIKDWGLTFKNYYVPISGIDKISQNITTTPTILILDNKGREVMNKQEGSSGQDDGQEEIALKLREKIERIINEKQ